jgi:hypothetical protein
VVLTVEILKLAANEKGEFHSDFRVTFEALNLVPVRQNQFIEVNDNVLLVGVAFENVDDMRFQSFGVGDVNLPPVVLALFFQVHRHLRLVVAFVAVARSISRHDQCVAPWVKAELMAAVQDKSLSGQEAFQVTVRMEFFLGWYGCSFSETALGPGFWLD